MDQLVPPSLQWPLEETALLDVQSIGVVGQGGSGDGGGNRTPPGPAVRPQPQQTKQGV